MSSLLKVISLVFYRKALSVQTFAVRHSTLALEAMITKNSVAILCLFSMSSNWSNKFLNQELFYKVIMALIGSDGLFSSSSPESTQMTTVATPFLLRLGSGFL